MPQTKHVAYEVLREIIQKKNGADDTTALVLLVLATQLSTEKHKNNWAGTII